MRAICWRDRVERPSHLLILRYVLDHVVPGCAVGCAIRNPLKFRRAFAVVLCLSVHMTHIIVSPYHRRVSKRPLPNTDRDGKSPEAHSRLVSVVGRVRARVGAYRSIAVPAAQISLAQLGNCYQT